MADKLEIKVCVGSSCHVRGGTNSLKKLEVLIEDSKLSDRIELKADLCLDNCLQAPNVIVDGEIFGGITPDVVEKFFKEQVLTKING